VYAPHFTPEKLGDSEAAGNAGDDAVNLRRQEDAQDASRYPGLRGANHGVERD
jgi:hypothetical protein